MSVNFKKKKRSLINQGFSRSNSTKDSSNQSNKLQFILEDNSGILLNPSFNFNRKVIPKFNSASAFQFNYIQNNLVQIVQTPKDQLGTTTNDVNMNRVYIQPSYYPMIYSPLIMPVPISSEDTNKSLGFLSEGGDKIYYPVITNNFLKTSNLYKPEIVENSGNLLKETNKISNNNECKIEPEFKFLPIFKSDIHKKVIQVHNLEKEENRISPSNSNGKEDINTDNKIVTNFQIYNYNDKQKVKSFQSLNSQKKFVANNVTLKDYKDKDKDLEWKYIKCSKENETKKFEFPENLDSRNLSIISKNIEDYYESYNDSDSILDKFDTDKKEKSPIRLDKTQEELDKELEVKYEEFRKYIIDQFETAKEKSDKNFIKNIKHLTKIIRQYIGSSKFIDNNSTNKMKFGVEPKHIYGKMKRWFLKISYKSYLENSKNSKKEKSESNEKPDRMKLDLEGFLLMLEDFHNLIKEKDLVNKEKGIKLATDYEKENKRKILGKNGKIKPTADNNFTYTCETCGRRFKTGAALGGHTSKQHPGTSEKYKLKLEIRSKREQKREIIQNAKKEYFKSYGYDYDELRKSNKKDLIKNLIKKADYRTNLELYKKQLKEND